MKVLHTADIHIGYETYGRPDPKTGLNTRLLDFKRSFDFMVQCAIDENVDAFLFCGDAYRTHDPTPTHQKVFAECLRPLASAGIPMVMITGNHDQPVSFGKASSIDIFRHLVGDVYVFDAPELKEIPTKSGLLQIAALPWPIRSKILATEEHRNKSGADLRAFIEEKYVDWVKYLAENKLNPALPAILAAHLTVQGADMSGSERSSLIQHEPTFMVGQLANPAFDYVALGHIHRHQDRNAGYRPPVVYSSSIERINFKEAGDEKGFVIVDIHPHPTEARRETTYRFVPTPARRFIAIHIQAKDASDPMGKILDTIARHDLTDAIVRVRYEIDEQQVKAIDQQAIRAALADADFIAAIERTVDVKQVQRSSTVTREMSLQAAMEAYVERRENLKPLKEELVSAALHLEEALEAEERGR